MKEMVPTVRPSCRSFLLEAGVIYGAPHGSPKRRPGAKGFNQNIKFF